MFRYMTCFLLTVLFAVNSVAHQADSIKQSDSPTSTDLETRRRALNDLLAEHWEYTLQSDPFTASEIGDRRWNDQLPDLSLAGWKRRFQTQRNFLARFESIDTSGFSIQEKLNKELMVRELKNSIEGERYRRYLMPVNQFWGVHIQVAELALHLSFSTVKDYDDFIARLKGIPGLFDQVTEVMRAGMKQGLVPPRILLEQVVDQARYIAGMNAEESPFASPLSQMLEEISANERNRIREELISVIKQQVMPAYRKFGDFVETEYVPAGGAEVGSWALPEGKERYAWFVRLRTTADMTPDEVHQLGLSEVARIEAEMLVIAKQLGYDDVKSLDAAVREKQEFRARSREEILDSFRNYISQMEGKLPELFGRLPKAKLIVVPIEEFREKEAAAAQYEPGTPDGSRPGHIMVNTYKPEDRNMKFIEAIAYHEGLPGHHLQVAIQQELPELPSFRQVGGNDAFREGWALYAEKLGQEVGFYRDPYSNYGRLQNEMLRAIRLVVDTGLHYKKWTRNQVVQYFRNHSALEEVTIQSETDRYIAWPAQALTYKVGELKILELRQRAKDKLKEHFDIREFHDAILGAGALPMAILEKHINDWIANRNTVRGSAVE